MLSVKKASRNWLSGGSAQLDLAFQWEDQAIRRAVQFLYVAYDH